MELDFLKQMMERRVNALALIQQNAFNVGDVEEYQKADEDLRQTRITLTQIETLLPIAVDAIKEAPVV